MKPNKIKKLIKKVNHLLLRKGKETRTKNRVIKRRGGCYINNQRINSQQSKRGEVVIVAETRGGKKEKKRTRNKLLNQIRFRKIKK